MANLNTDIKTVRVEMRRLAQVTRTFAEDFRNCAEMGETGEVLNGATMTQELHEQAEIFAERVAAWAAALEDQQQRVAAIFHRYHAAEQGN